MARHYGALPPGDPHGDPEDCGPFCVWWYTQPVSKINEKRWAYALRSVCGTYWHTSHSKSGFRTRQDAVAAGTEAVRG
jgi:hypothetical protein